MNHFGFSLCSFGIFAGLMAMLFMLMIMPSSTDGFKIYVTLPVEVEDTDTVATLKQRIQDETDIPPEKQTLRTNNAFALPLEDAKTIKECGINGESKIILSMDEFEIYMNNGNKNYTITVNENDTVAILKQKIAVIIGIPPKQQTLRSEDNPNGHVLVDETKLKDYKIFKNSYVYLTEFKIPIWFKGDFYEGVIMKGADTVQNFKQEIKSRIENNLNYFVDDKCSNFLIGEIKLRRHTTAGIIELPDNGTLDECGINGVDGIDMTFDQNQSFAAGKLTMLIMITYGMKIEVSYGREYYDVEVNKKDTVATLKRKIENIQKIGHIPAEEQTLRWHTNGPVLNASNKTLGEYGIKKGDPIIVSRNNEYQIFVQYKGKEHRFVVKALETVQNLKEKITQRIDILPEKQVLSRDPDSSNLYNQQTMEYYGIVKDDTVFLSLDFKIIVTRGSWLGAEDEASFRVMGTDTVQSLKDRIRKKKGGEWYCAKREITLRKNNGTVLENNEATLEHYGIGPQKEKSLEFYCR